MTEYEIVDALGTYSSGMQSWAALYMSLVTAFLATAYLAGKKLTKSQVLIVGACFVFFACMAVFGVLGLGFRMAEFAAELGELRPDSMYMSRVEGIWFFGFMMLFGIIVSLKFMWDVRHPKAE